MGEAYNGPWRLLNGKSNFLNRTKILGIAGRKRAERAKRGREGAKGAKGGEKSGHLSGGYCGFCSSANHEPSQPPCESATPKSNVLSNRKYVLRMWFGKSSAGRSYSVYYVLTVQST